MRPNPTRPIEFGHIVVIRKENDVTTVTFTEEILNGKLHLLRSGGRVFANNIWQYFAECYAIKCFADNQTNENQGYFEGFQRY